MKYGVIVHKTTMNMGDDMMTYNKFRKNKIS